MHAATSTEIERANSLVRALADEFDALMDARVGPGRWGKPTDAENAAMEAEMSIEGWISVAGDGHPLRHSLDEHVRRLTDRLIGWGWSIPAALTAAPGGKAGA